MNDPDAPMREQLLSAGFSRDEADRAHSDLDRCLADDSHP